MKDNAMKGDLKFTDLNGEFRYAELPDGKILKFSKETSDLEMQRAVRRELKVDSMTIMEAIDDLTDSVKEAATLRKEIVSEIGDAFKANANRISGELSDAIRDMRGMIAEFHGDLRKQLSTQANLVVKMQVTMDMLNQTMDHALGQSLSAMDASNGGTAAVVKSIDQMGAMVDGMRGLMQEMTNLKKLKRRAVRQKDGSHIFETTS